MKKGIVIVVALAVFIGISCSAFAAPIYSDVPLNHWAYQSIAKLAKAGIIEGYSNGTFNGGKTLTRYEMAVIVANAMTKEEKADGETKAEIAKLEAEFSSELNQLGVRVSNVEKRMDAAEKFQFKINSRQIWEHASNPTPNASNSNPSDLYYHNRFFMQANLDPNAQFITMWESTDDISSDTYTTSQGSTFTGKQAYLRAKVGNTIINMGRQPFSWLGNGLVCDNSGKWDGVTAESMVGLGNGSSFKIRYGLAERYMGASGVTFPDVVYPTAATHEFYMYNAKYTVNPNFNIISVYLKDQGVRNVADSSYYDSLSIGENWKLDANWTLMSEFARNNAYLAKFENQNKAPKAMYAQLKYKNADQNKIGTWDIFTDYRKAESGFDLEGMTTLDDMKNWNASANVAANDIKGFDFVYEYIPFKNVILSLRDYRLTGNSNSSIKYNGYALRMDYYF